MFGPNAPRSSDTEGFNSDSYGYGYGGNTNRPNRRFNTEEDSESTDKSSSDPYANGLFGLWNGVGRVYMASYDMQSVFVGGISLETGEADLQNYFVQFGEVKNVQIKYDAASGRSRGFAFVEFATPDACKASLANRVHEIRGKRCEVKRATSREHKKVFVGGVSSDVTDDELKIYFQKYGEVEDVEFPVDKTTNRRRNFCFVIFKDEPGAQAAIEQKKHMIGDKYCDVKLFQPSPPKQQTPGYGYGYGYDAASAYGGAEAYAAQAAAAGGAYGGAGAQSGQYPPEYQAYWNQYWQYYYGQYYNQYAQAYGQGGGAPGAQGGAPGAQQQMAGYPNYYQQQQYEQNGNKE